MPIYIDGNGGDIDSGDDTTWRSSWTAYFNGGGHEALAPRGGAGTREHSLIRFNLSAIPAGSICNSATLYLYHYQIEVAPNPATGTIHEVANANGDWVAGNKNIAIASLGETTWQAKQADGNDPGATLVAWAGSVGCGTSGTDFVAAVIGSWSENPANPLGTEVSISLDTTTVAGWFGIINNGIILYPTNNSEVHFCSSDYITANYRPKLVVDYSLAPAGGGNHIKILGNEILG